MTPVLRLLLDQGIPQDSAKLFRNLVYDCLHVAEITRCLLVANYFRPALPD